MNTFFGTLWHRIALSNKEQLVWFGVVVIIMIVLAVLHHKWKGDSRKIRLWRVLCFLPAVIAAVHALICRIDRLLRLQPGNRRHQRSFGRPCLCRIPCRSCA